MESSANKESYVIRPLLYLQATTAGFDPSFFTLIFFYNKINNFLQQKKNTLRCVFVWPGYSYFFRVPSKSLDFGPNTESRLPFNQWGKITNLLVTILTILTTLKIIYTPSPSLGLFLSRFSTFFVPKKVEKRLKKMFRPASESWSKYTTANTHCYFSMECWRNWWPKQQNLVFSGRELWL